MFLNFLRLLKFVCLAITLLTYSSNIIAQQFTFDFNDRCDQIYTELISLRIENGKMILGQEKAAHPNNLITVMLENYEDFVLLMLNGDPQKYATQKKMLDKRITLIEKGSKKSPWYNYTKANIYFQWATIQIRFGDYLSAGNNFRKSHLLIKENVQLFPQFKYNNILLGLQEAVVGTIPDGYKWISNMLGMRGNVINGVGKIVNFLNTKDGSAKYLREEVVFYYCFLKFSLLSDQDYVWKYLKASQLDFENNMLYNFLYARLSLTDNKAAQATDILNKRNKSAAYPNLPLFDYLQGLAYFYQDDQKCIPHLKRFIDNYKGNLYIKHAYQILSLYYFSEGNLEESDKYRNSIAQKGNELVDADKQALRFSKEYEVPHPKLLKVRMAMDGGMTDKALKLIKAIDKQTLVQNPAYELEYLYRFGRIYAMMHQNREAISFFEQTLNKGYNRKEHFAARSSLEIGYIYEETNQKNKAIEYYKKCIAMKNHDYKSSIDQKAKAGINRLQ